MQNATASQTPSSGSVCRSCGAPITWGKTAKGRNCPYDADGKSHFETCPNAKSHSKTNSSVGDRLDRLEKRVDAMARWLKDNVHPGVNG